jgi:hypothetical protein
MRDVRRTMRVEQLAPGVFAGLRAGCEEGMSDAVVGARQVRMLGFGPWMKDVTGA